MSWKDMKDKIKRWFWRQRAGTMGIHSNPYFAHLAQLRRDESTMGPPKRPADFQWYMRHADFKEGVSEHFVEKHGDKPKEQHIAFHCQVAREMLMEESEEVQSQIKAECDAAHSEDLEAYEESGAGLPDVSEEVQRQCRENFLAIVQPLLAGLHEYTGLTLNIIGARINNDTQDFETMSANTGVVGGKDWARWDPEGYSSTLKNYLRFVHARHLESKNLMDAGPSYHAFKCFQRTLHGVHIPSDLLESNGLLCFDLDKDVDMGPLPPPPIMEDGDDEALEKGIQLPTITLAPSVPTVTPAPSAPIVTPAPSAPAVTAAPSSRLRRPRPSSTPCRPHPRPSIIRDELRAEILAKSGDEHENWLRELRRMNDYWLEHENNMARNRKLLKDMDLNQVTNLLGMKCPKGGRGGGKASSRKKAKKGMEDKWSSESDSADDDDGGSSDEEENQDGPARERTPLTTRVRAAHGAGTAKGGAKWAETARSILLEVEMGVDWKDVVSLWWTLEELWKFATSTKSHATTHRPKAVGVWVKNARKGNPDIGSASGMEWEWWAW
ncbi:hypothetical protein DFH08DRAFT_955405 [Mycena albidolilacea]|uniref:Uncharacterized protein n=1 Tax=Mycena albidolilacea TaxID=1033008 RepID=A0AAD7ADX0_9AGAR|nr:hypothetical protein DFH08DRAFT_955405 [Mycena albidolilacea]